MKTLDYQAVELSKDELENIEGGFLPLLLGGIAICGAYYGAGHAVGQALYYATHP